MSIALFNAITGLTNFQRVLDVVGNNISNMQTPGYKRSSVSFKELLSQTLKGASSPSGGRGGTNPFQIGLGSSLGGISTQYTQGILQTTGRATDLAITGSGFFIVKSDASTGYTRNGCLSIDVNGNLVDGNGYKVQGWLAQNGEIDSSGGLQNIEIPIGEASIATATQNISYTGNLDATQETYAAGPPVVGGVYLTESVVYDSLGKEHKLTLEFKKTGDSAWSFDAQIDDEDAGSGNVAFLTDGSLDVEGSDENPLVEYDVGEGAEELSIALDFSDMTQLATPGQYSVAAKNQDGFETGTLQSFIVDNSGKIVGSFSNGFTRTVGQIALADFLNPEGLEKTDSGILKETANSGAAQVGIAGSGSRGSLTSGALELSNVDLSSEFTNMIIAQRAFQANSRVVTVMDKILEEMANLKR
ncbi:MAG: flagellar hook protein FlgE [Candidatus Eremiobacteraeota bacterium]|nr:flagellar hook protein FlgE [Candidatus Eremiobacteraeota bacterium]